MKSAIFGISILASLLSVMPVHALLSGSARITPQDYIGLPAAALANNPPACGMPYGTLDLSRITAVQALDKTTDCNKCIKVVNTENNKFVYVLAVDLGGSGLDLSIPSFKKLFGQQYDASPASWSETDYSNCAGIYKGGSSNSSSQVTSKKPSPTHAPTKTKSAPHIRPTTTKVIKKSSSHPRPTKVKKPTTLARPTGTKTKSAHHGRPTKTKSAHHGRPTKTKSAKHHPTHKTKSPGRGCASNKQKKHSKKQSSAGRRKHQRKQH